MRKAATLFGLLEVTIAWRQLLNAGERPTCVLPAEVSCALEDLQGRFVALNVASTIV